MQRSSRRRIRLSHPSSRSRSSLLVTETSGSWKTWSSGDGIGSILYRRRSARRVVELPGDASYSTEKVTRDQRSTSHVVSRVMHVCIRVTRRSGFGLSRECPLRSKRRERVMSLASMAPTTLAHGHLATSFPVCLLFSLSLRRWVAKSQETSGGFGATSLTPCRALAGTHKHRTARTAGSLVQLLAR